MLNYHHCGRCGYLLYGAGAYVMHACEAIVAAEAEGRLPPPTGTPTPYRREIPSLQEAFRDVLARDLDEWRDVPGGAP